MSKNETLQVAYLNTDGLTQAVKNISESAKQFNDVLIRVERAKIRLLSSWVGKSRDEFEGQYAIIFRQLSDLEKGLIEVHEALIKSQVVYYDIDNEVARELQQ